MADLLEAAMIEGPGPVLDDHDPDDLDFDHDGDMAQLTYAGGLPGLQIRGKQCRFEGRRRRQRAQGYLG